MFEEKESKIKVYKTKKTFLKKPLGNRDPIDGRKGPQILKQGKGKK